MANDAKNQPATVAMMLAMDKNKLIGKDGGLPWHIPGELAYFKSVTMGKPILMGRVSYDSIGRPLPGRENIVVTRNAEWKAEGVHACTSLDDALSIARGFIQNESSDNNELVVIGGAALCRAAMPMTTKVYLTYIDHAYEGDVWFDSFHWDDWREESRTDMEQDGLRYSYYVLQRKESG